MSFVAFRSKKFSAAKQALVDASNHIIEEYRTQGYRLTLRQLYYQLVSRDLIPNQQRWYKRLGDAIVDARYNGEVSWDAIEDRVRQPRILADFDSAQECVEDALRTFRLPRWNGQDTYAELWVEKEALAGILRPLADKYHVTLMVNRGYSSASAMYEAAERFRQAEDSGHATHLFYLGDHDPSGLDMDRDIRERLNEFDAWPEVTRLALTQEQIAEYGPPPNPAKVTDSRAESYIEQFGSVSWEVDALTPQALNSVITRAFESILDGDMLAAVRAEELAQKEAAVKAVREAFA